MKIHSSPFLIFLGLIFIAISLPIGAHAAPNAPLSGNYTIGTGGDYATISAAVSDLNSLGISDPVSFKIVPGNYNEQVTINAFTRTGAADDRVTFSGTGTVNWGSTGGGAAVITLNDADYLTFENINFIDPAATGIVKILLDGGTITGLTVNNNSFVGVCCVSGTAIGSVSSTTFQDSTISNNTFSLGLHAISLASSGLVERTFNVTISDNEIADNRLGGIKLSGADNVISGNTITTDSGQGVAASYIGIEIYGDDNLIEANHFVLKEGGTGLLYEGESSTSCMIRNNMVAVASPDGLIGVGTDSDSADLCHNTIIVSAATSTSSVGVHIDASTTGSGTTQLLNNIVYNRALGYALEIDDTDTVSASNFNMLLSAGTQTIRADGVDYIGIPTFNTATGFDADSVAVIVDFVSLATFDLHLDGTSQTDEDLLAPPVGVSADFDGDPRNIFFTMMGADEATWTPLDNADTVSGIYTVGGSNPDYATVEDAVDALNIRGIKGDVTFNIRAGTYDTHATIGNFTRHNGATTNPVKFRAANNANWPTLQHDAADADDNWVMKLANADFVEFRQLNFVALDTTSTANSNIIEFADGSDDNIIDNNLFTGPLGGRHIYSASSAVTNRNQISNNTFTGGDGAIYFDEPSSGPSNGTIIEENTFEGQYDFSIQINHADVVIRANTIQLNSTAGSYEAAINLTWVDGFEVVDNVINLQSTGFTSGFNIWSSNGSFATPALIANNFVQAERGVSVGFNSKRIDLVHNTIVATDDYGVRVFGAFISDIALLNNIYHFAGGVGDSVLDVEDSSTIVSNDYNLFDSNSGVFWDGVAISVGPYIASNEPNSVEKAVNFADAANGNLHLAGSSVGDSDLAGTPLAYVTTDIDGEARSTTAPYMGADEAMGVATAVQVVGISAESSSSGLAETIPVYILTLLLTGTLTVLSISRKGIIGR